ncbi:putative uncharacterized protein [Parachlamydia acanthamoebae UV-7]|uniref:Uncharacterized protein n=2 Tax=Parachlamydia acanthamoebae TaxID=83552 RepID=F8L015_PARAV|nr:hypothetical protein DB43_FU00040 [Parachlamydia acanthamoebae]CCB86529.1 putative uncharacterized protein [Parachlamydia acanthamoebae UV-7]
MRFIDDRANLKTQDNADFYRSLHLDDVDRKSKSSGIISKVFANGELISKIIRSFLKIKI